jgi:protein TonB
MFESSLNSSSVPRRKLGVGALFSIAAHAVAVVAVIYAGRHIPAKTLEAPEVVFWRGEPPPPPASLRRSDSPSPSPTAPRKASAPVPHETFVPRESKKRVEVAVDKPSHTGGELRERPGPANGEADGRVGTTGTSEPDSALPPTNIVLPFGEGMNRPELVEGPEPIYKPEALAANLQGTVLARCVITTEGTLQGCRIIKSLRYLDQSVLDALARRRYRPVSFQGHPIAVDYVIEFKFKTT